MNSPLADPFANHDNGTVYTVPEEGVPAGKGKHVYFVHWYDESRPIDVVAGHLTPGGWRGQIFHTDESVDSGRALAQKLGRKFRKGRP
jgi:hypothetical protein